MGVRTARGGKKKHVGTQGMGSDIENRADDLKGDSTKTLGYCVDIAVGALLIRTSTCPARAGPTHGEERAVGR